MKILVFMFIVIFPQLMKGGKILKTEKLIKFRRFKNIKIIRIKIQELLAV